MPDRHQYILNIIKRKPIGDQLSLINELKIQYGLHTNQTTISRDLQSLGIVKKKINDQWQYEQTSNEAIKQMLKLAVSNIQHNQVQIVVTTMPGTAAIVADYLDDCDDLPILGTISGETAVFVAPVSTNDIKRIFKRVAQVLNFNVPAPEHVSE